MINIVIPMAGLGTRFTNRGYKEPKPLISIKDKPMIEWVVSNIKPEAEHRFIFVCRKEHLEGKGLGEILEKLAPGCEIITTPGTTAGQAASLLLAKGFIDNDDELLTANSDQYIEASVDEFIKTARKDNVDGLIMTFKATDPKWSFAKVDEGGYVVETAEKKTISDNATVGIFYFKHGKDFIESAEDMIRKNLRVNKEFYTCPTYNELIAKGGRVKTFEIDKSRMHGLGTPDDLEDFLETEIYKNG